MMAQSETNRNEFFRRKKDVEARVGGLREEWAFDSVLDKVRTRERILSQPNGEQFLKQINWAGLETIFQEYAIRSDPNYLLYKHDLIATSDRIRFFDRSDRHGSASAECYPTVRLILFDFDSLQKQARRKGLDEE